MNEQETMENLLLLTKGVCDLYMHGVLESAGTEDVRTVFSDALYETLEIQNSIYEAMTEKGYYQIKNAPQSKVDALKNKFQSEI